MDTPNQGGQFKYHLESEERALLWKEDPFLGLISHFCGNPFSGIRWSKHFLCAEASVYQVLLGAKVISRCGG